MLLVAYSYLRVVFVLREIGLGHTLFNKVWVQNLLGIKKGLSFEKKMSFSKEILDTPQFHVEK